jgi:chaperone required for assembly of F1-ATPase
VSEWTARRFWTAAEVVREGAGWSLRLDGRPVRTPSKRLLVAPTAAMANAFAAEWDAQGDLVDPSSMPVTRAASTAIDKVDPHRDEVVATLAAYGATDLLCYRAESPDALSLRQAAVWDPLLLWAHETLGVRLVSVAGVMPHPQDEMALDRLAAAVASMDVFVLTGFHDLVTLSGSLVLGLAVERGRLTAAEAWAMSRIDEVYQADLWGRDGEADRVAAIRRDAFLEAHRFVSLSRNKPLQL